MSASSKHIPCKINPMGSSIDERLPSGYKRVDYIEAVDNQYIYTGWKCTGGASFDLEGYMFNDGKAGVICGSHDGLNWARIGFNKGYANRIDYWRVDVTIVAGGGAYPTNQWFTANYVGTNQKGYLKINDKVWYESDAPVDIQPSGTFYVFSVRYPPQNSTCHARLRRLDIYDAEGNMKYKFRPALDPNGRPCLFDFVRQKPFYNSGTGEFLYA